MPSEFRLQQDELCVRPMQPADAAAVQRCRNLPEVSRYQGWRPATVAEVVDLAQKQVGRTPGMQREPLQLVIEVREGGGGGTQVVGDMGGNVFDPGRQMGIGIVLDPRWQNRGLATRACRLLIDHLFTSGLHRVTARVDPRNTSSLRLLERLRFRREGLERACWWDEVWSEWTDEVCFAMLSSEWLEAPGVRQLGNAL